MIGSVTKEIGGTPEVFRMTTRAMMALEDHFKCGIAEVLEGLEGGFRMADLARMLSECANGGAGSGIEKGQDVVDKLGVSGAGELLAEIALAAFPEASKEDAPKN